MEPRLPSSKMWTSLPEDYIKQIQEAFAESFPSQASQGQFVVEGRLYPEEILLRAGYLPNNQLKQSNFEISLAYKKGKDDVIQLIHTGVDVAATMLDDLFQKGQEEDLPRIWMEFEVENKTLFIQYSTTNSSLEEQASRLLKEHDEGLVKGSDPEKEIAAIKKGLGLDDDDAGSNEDRG